MVSTHVVDLPVASIGYGCSTRIQIVSRRALLGLPGNRWHNGERYAVFDDSIGQETMQ